MQLIFKGTEPKKLTEYRASGARYSDGMDPEYRIPLIEQLLTEQGYRCAYCGGRLQKPRVKIEHWATQSLHPDRDLDYTNLLAVCYGDLFCRTELHCDRSRKDNTDLVLNPQRADHIAQIEFRYDGRIVLDNTELFFDLDSPNRLNLNCPELVQKRRQLLSDFRIHLSRLHGRGKAINFGRLLADQQASRESFNDIILWYLRRKIQSQG